MKKNKEYRYNNLYFTSILFIFLLFGIKNSNAAIRTSTAIGGVWSAGGTWVGGIAPVAGDDAIIATTAGNSVTLGGANRTIVNLTINNSAILDNNGGIRITVNGNYINNGIHSGTGNIRISGVGTTIDGVGIITNSGTFDIRNGNQTIIITANLTKTSGNFRINGAWTITNNGIITLGSNLTGTVAGSTWINSLNSTLNIGGNLLNTGTLTATAAGNTVNYNGSIAQTIRATSYYNLTYSGTNTGTLGGNTNVAGNLAVSSGTFNTTTNSTTVTLNGTAAVQNVTGAITFYNLTLNNTFATIPQITMNNNIITNNILTMTSGIVNLAGNTFTLGVNGVASTLTRAASTTTNWFYGGTFKRFWLNATTISSTAGNFYGLFPMGTANASSYRPVQLNSTGNITTNGFFTVNHVAAGNTVTDLSPTYNDAGTNITRIHNAQFVTAISGVTVGTFSISATMTGLLAGTLSDIRLAIFTGGTTASAVGTHSAATGTAPNPTAIRTGITTLTDLNNDFRVSTTNIAATPLPIELISFTANCDNNKNIILNWSTASEINNDYFTIEHSMDGFNWEFVTTIKGAGNSENILNYSFIDNELYNETSYYRLKQIDYDGKSTTFNIVSIEKCEDNLTKLNFYPNPVQDILIIETTLKQAEQYIIRIINLEGKILYTKEFNGDFGINSFYFDTSILNKGIYIVQIKTNSIIYSNKLLKQ